jgi:hypothetical protein
MIGLLFYDPSTGTGEFYETNVLGEMLLLKRHTDWRHSWTIIVPGNFGGDGNTDLLFYDAGAGNGEFDITDGKGGISRISQYSGWRNSWTFIIPGSFSNSGHTDLLFYDRAGGTGEFYKTNGKGGMSLIRSDNTWRNSWTQIVPGEFGGGNNFTDLLFYEAASGTGQFYATDGKGGIKQLNIYTNWRHTWTHIIPGSFGGDRFTDLFFYDAASGVGEFYATDGHGGISLLKQVTLPANIKMIVPGSFGGSGYTGLLMYSGATGDFYTTDGSGNIHLLKRHTDFRTSWTQIAPGYYGGSNFTFLNAPTNLQVTQVLDLTINLAWSYQPGSETGFKIRYRGKREGFSDDNGERGVSNSARSASIQGLKSGYQYTLTIVSFNQAGESSASNQVQATTPGRTINVTKQGSGSSAIFVVTGTGFTANSRVVIKATSPQLQQVQFVATAGGDGKFQNSQGIPCQTGLQITFTAFEDANPTGTFANSVVTNCP